MPCAFEAARSPRKNQNIKRDGSEKREMVSEDFAYASP